MFEVCKSTEEVKNLFRKLARHLHPDAGGDSFLMNRLQESKEYHLWKMSLPNESTKDCETKTKDYKTEGYEESYEDIFEEDSRIEIIQDIFNYAKSHPRFCTSFVESVSDYLEKKGYITSAQYNSLVRCYYAFRMNQN